MTGLNSAEAADAVHDGAMPPATAQFVPLAHRVPQRITTIPGDVGAPGAGSGSSTV